MVYGYESATTEKGRFKTVTSTIGSESDVFTYDPSGQRITRTDTLGTNPDLANAFKYNERSEVTGADMDGTSGFEYGYAYDDIGNRGSITQPGTPATVAYSPNALNQYDAVGGTTYQHDDDGNLTADGEWSYEWNGENRLKAMESSASVPLADRKRKGVTY